MTHDEHIILIAMNIDAKMQSFKVLVNEVAREANKLLMLLRASDTLRDSLDNIERINDNPEPEDD